MSNSGAEEQPEDDLRERAESAIKSQPVKRAEPRRRDERLLYELEVHRVQLEMQFEQLRSAQLELAESRDRYRELFDLAPVAYVALDRASKVIEANLTACSLLGVDRARLRGQHLSGFMLEPAADQLHLQLRAVFTSGGKLGCDLVLEVAGSRGKRSIPVRAEALASMDDTGQIAECRMALVDLSEREHTQRTFHAFMDAANDACCVCSADLQLIYANPAALALFPEPTQLEDIVGKTLMELAPGIEREARYQRYLEVLRTGKPALLQAIQIHPRFGEREMDVSVFKVGEGLGFIITDVTERQRAQRRATELARQLQQAQKLEAIGTLASGVAHDFNNLLMSISSCADVARGVLPADSAASMYLEEIRRSVKTGSAITRQLLTFSRKSDVQTSVFELNAVVTRSERMLQRLLGEDIELSVRLDAEDSRVRADAVQIEQVLVNLALNARDAMPKGGPLSIRTRDVSLAAGGNLPVGDYVALTIVDAGMGMSPDTLGRVFDPFFTTKAPDRGTGLGLSTVHGIVKAAGGRVDVSSRLGHGSTFEVLLPKTELPLTSQLEVTESTNDRSGEGKTVLLVEDESAVRLGVKYYLEGAGYRVLEASSGPEAVECCRRFPEPIDLLLTDVVLPGLGGAESARQVSELKPGIAIVFMSAHPKRWLVEQGRLWSNARTLQKPFGSRRLLATLSEVLTPDQSRRETKRQRRMPRLRKARVHRVRDSATTQSQQVQARGTILLAEDEHGARMAITDYLSSLNWHVLGAPDGPRAVELAAKSQKPIDVLLLDYSLPGMTGDLLAREVLKVHRSARVVYMSGHPELDPDPPGLLLSKPLDLDAVASAVESQLAEGQTDP